jgi:DHA3 family multidrug efflux protein-like MFS transporter
MAIAPSSSKLFYWILANSLVAGLTNTVVWFSTTFWAYLQTRSVLVTSIMMGIYLVTVAVSGVFLGALVDRQPKKTAMMLSSLGSAVAYLLAYLLFTAIPASAFTQPTSPSLWGFIFLLLMGVIVGNIRSIALPTLVTILIPEAERDKANGLVGTVNGVAFLLASICSGLLLGFLGIYWMLVVAIALTLLAMLHLLTIPLTIADAIPAHQRATTLDLRGTIQVVHLVPGLFALIFFNCFNNFLGGVFTALMDAYGLSLVSVKIWGTLWGCLSLGFILGSLVVANKGLGKNPLKQLFCVNIVMWHIAIFFTIRSSVLLLAIGLLIYLSLIPVVEAAEQTIIQKVIPPERQGRVFGFAQSIEQAASPLTAFMVGPIAQFVFIPFMTTGEGVKLLGSWFGTGSDRGIALLFTVTGVIGLVVTLIAMQLPAYRSLSRIYQD